MQKVVNQYAEGWSLPTEQAPYKGCLYPRQEIATLSVSAGGLVFVELVTQWSSDPTEINSTAMRHVVKR